MNENHTILKNLNNGETARFRTVHQAYGHASNLLTDEEIEEVISLPLLKKRLSDASEVKICKSWAIKVNERKYFRVRMSIEEEAELEEYTDRNGYDSISEAIRDISKKMLEFDYPKALSKSTKTQEVGIMIDKNHFDKIANKSREVEMIYREMFFHVLYSLDN